MKRFLCTLLCALLVLTAAPLTVFAAGSPPVIGLAAGATEQDRAAAETLRQYLAQMLPTAPVLGAVTDADFIIGGVPAGEALPAGGYRITRQNGGAVSIAGAGSTGVQNGVYAFLRDFCGCRWYTPSVSKIPQKPSLCIDENTDIVETPAFEYRESFFNGNALDGPWAARNRCNGHMPRLYAHHGGKIA